MGAGSSAKLLAAGSTWRLTGLDAAGRSLVSAIVDGGEDEQTLAGIMLVKAGDRSVRLIAEAISAGATSPELVDVLASIGTENARGALQQATHAEQRDVADAAEQALRTLDEVRRHQQ
jgi:radical SAM superfamily enzyme with C-terminal helix-hairpin-helix motif